MSPARTSRAGLAFNPLASILPRSQALLASARVLKNRAAQSHCVDAHLIHSPIVFKLAKHRLAESSGHRVCAPATGLAILEESAPSRATIRSDCLRSSPPAPPPRRGQKSQAAPDSPTPCRAVRVRTSEPVNEHRGGRQHIKQPLGKDGQIKLLKLAERTATAGWPAFPGWPARWKGSGSAG